MPRQYIKALLKNYLLSGKSITGLQALKRWGTIRLAVYIQRLRNDGYKIKTEMVTEKGKTFARYRHTI
jgi:biotin operon repressor